MTSGMAVMGQDLFQVCNWLTKAVGRSWSSGKAGGGSIPCSQNRVCSLLQLHRSE